MSLHIVPLSLVCLMYGIKTVFCFFFSFIHFFIALQLFSLQLSYLNNVSLLLKTNHALWLRMLLSRRKVLVAQCPTLCSTMDCRPAGSSVHGILQAIILAWVAISFSPGDLPSPGIKPGSPALQADSVPSHEGNPK